MLEWIVCVVLVAAVLAPGAAAEAPGWQPEEFPISYWVGPPVEQNRLDAWQTVANANFTVAGPMWGYSVAENRKMLDFCRQVGIKALVVDSRISPDLATDDALTKHVSAIVKDYADHPALYGYYLQDEPNDSLFPLLGRLSAAFLRRDPKRLPYINLFPTYASVAQLGTPTYADHVDRYLRLVKPPVLSYDHYCLMQDGTDRADYFENLGLIREYGLRYNTPPWNIILSLPHLAYRDPTDAEMRWQVYTSLAYGMKGIMYFTYWTGKEDDQAGRMAIVDSQGRPTKRYGIIRQLNGEMKVLGRILLGLTSTGVYHSGEIPPGCTRAGTDLPLTLPAEQPLVLGLFRGRDGSEWAMVVNRDYDRAQDVTLGVKGHVASVGAISPADGKETALPLADGKLTLQLAPGDGRLLRLLTRFAYAELPKPVSEIRFEFDRDTEGWGGLNSLEPLAVQNGILRSKVVGPDPFFSRGWLRIPANRYKEVVVRMRLRGATSGQFFWTTSAEPNFGDDKYLSFPVNGDGQFHEYVIPVGKHPKWKGQAIRAIRLDPTVGGCIGETVEIDYIRGR
ncbi:MAG: hypothetical protein GX774_11660 [Armatimonadetes bacterium]|jgi:hypothetical protein|nr:hypothetical protein [Armatimonadota bacterium]